VKNIYNFVMRNWIAFRWVIGWRSGLIPAGTVLRNVTFEIVGCICPPSETSATCTEAYCPRRQNGSNQHPST
jgi:hypothetical protein